GKSAAAGGEVEYDVHVANCTDEARAITLSFEKYGWEAMTATVEPATLQLAPQQSADVRVRVKVSARIPPGGHEKQVLKAVANAAAASAVRLEFVTASALPHPNILHTPQRWQEVRDKLTRYNWAKAARAEWVAAADAWTVPEIAKSPRNLTGVDNMGPFLFATQNENGLM